MLARRPCGRDAQVGLVLGKVKDLRAVDEHGVTGLTGIQPALVDFTDVRDQLALDAARLTQQRREALEKLVVGQRAEAEGGDGRRYVVHNDHSHMQARELIS